MGVDWLNELAWETLLAHAHSKQAQDPQFQALESVTTVDDPELGPIKMQNVMCRLSDTPGQIKWAGHRVGQDNAEVYGELLGLNAEQLQALSEKGVI